MARRDGLVRLGVAALVLAIAAGVAVAETTVTMWTFLDPAKTGGRERALKSLIDSFEAKNPGVRIKVEPQVWTTLAEKFVLGHNAGNAPDISWVNTENLGLILNTDAAADLGKLVTGKWSAERRADLALPGALDSVAVKGRTLAVPLMSITWVLMYRRDLLAQVGLTPDALATWAGVTDAARRLTRDTNGDGSPDVWGIGLGLAQERFSATPAVLATIDAEGGLFRDGCEARIATPGGERALALQARWITEDKVSPREALSMTSDDAIDQLAAGRYAMMIVANSRFEQIQRTAAGWSKDNLAIAPIPGWDKGKPGPTLITGWYAVAWSKSPRLEAAASFLDHMASPEGMALWNVPGGQVPMLRSLARRPEMEEPGNLHLRQVAEHFAASGRFMPGACNWSRTFADFNLATQQVVLGQKTVGEALKQAERATQDRQ